MTVNELEKVVQAFKERYSGLCKVYMATGKGTGDDLVSIAEYRDGDEVFLVLFTEKDLESQEFDNGDVTLVFLE